MADDVQATDVVRADHVRIDCTDEGKPCGHVEVDLMPDGFLVEVFDASHFEGQVTSAVTYMTAEQAHRLAAALTGPCNPPVSPGGDA